MFNVDTYTVTAGEPGSGELETWWCCPEALRGSWVKTKRYNVFKYMCGRGAFHFLKGSGNLPLRHQEASLSERLLKLLSECREQRGGQTLSSWTEAGELHTEWTQFTAQLFSAPISPAARAPHSLHRHTPGHALLHLIKGPHHSYNSVLNAACCASHHISSHSFSD